MVIILMILSGAIILSLYFGGDVTRRPVIAEISGSAYITRNGKRLRADKNSSLQNGDVLSTETNGTVRIQIDTDKYVFVEPDSYLYIYYTDIAGKGDIAVNLSRGAVICQLNDKLKKNSTFVLKTPNGVIDVKGTVFRTEFSFHEAYRDYTNVMITDVQSFDGTVNLQLYDDSQEPFDLPMVLMERTSARMITADGVCQYSYLNYNIDLLSMEEMTLREVLRSANETRLAFSLDEINSAYIAVVNRNRLSKDEIPVSSQEPTETELIPPPTSSSASPSDAAAESSDSEGSTWGTTRATHIYTTYSGIKWWEITRNGSTDDDSDYDDWFSENQNANQPAETVTAGTSAEP